MARNGTAVNFYLPTMPIEIIDLVFSEITECMVAIHRGAWHYVDKQGEKREAKVLLHQINESPPERLDFISKEWLRCVNMEAQA